MTALFTSPHLAHHSFHCSCLPPFDRESTQTFPSSSGNVLSEPIEHSRHHHPFIVVPNSNSPRATVKGYRKRHRIHFPFSNPVTHRGSTNNHTGTLRCPKTTRAFSDSLGGTVQRSQIRNRLHVSPDFPIPFPIQNRIFFLEGIPQVLGHSFAQEIFFPTFSFPTAPDNNEKRTPSRHTSRVTPLLSVWFFQGTFQKDNI